MIGAQQPVLDIETDPMKSHGARGVPAPAVLRVFWAFGDATRLDYEQPKYLIYHMYLMYFRGHVTVSE